jgi:hypothetical protein
MSNPWIAHVRRFAEQKGVTYACALSDPTIKTGYVKQSKPSVMKAPKAAPAPKVKKEKAPKAAPAPKVKKEKAPKAAPAPKVKKDKASSDALLAAKAAREALKKISADEKQLAKEQKKADSDAARLAAIDIKLAERKAAAKAKLAETLD